MPIKKHLHTEVKHVLIVSLKLRVPELQNEVLLINTFLVDVEVSIREDHLAFSSNFNEKSIDEGTLQK